MRLAMWCKPPVSDEIDRRMLFDRQAVCVGKSARAPEWSQNPRSRSHLPANREKSDENTFSKRQNHCSIAHEINASRKEAVWPLKANGVQGCYLRADQSAA